jgi:anthranilate synthase/aminodeoxychorismate synthase-like glutamine amidotransferase
MLILIDNYDSFTYNLVEYFTRLGQKVKIYRNDKVTIDEILDQNPDYIVLSPGPCTPTESGICLDLILQNKNIPMLGVCLGHQAIIQAFGGKIIKAPSPEHGKIHPIYHNEIGIYKNIPSPLNVTRYHSLIADESTLPSNLIITAKTIDNIIMSFQSLDNKLFGVQYHPESICTEYGIEILKNFLDIKK